MREGPPPVYHPSRTLGGGRTEIFGTPENESLLPGDPKAQRRNELIEKFNTQKTVSLRTCEKVSAFLSLGAIIATGIVIGTDASIRSAQIVLTTYDAKVLKVGSDVESNQNAIDTFTGSWDQLKFEHPGSDKSITCPSSELALLPRSYTYQDDGVDKDIAVKKMPGIVKTTQTLNAWAMLISVLVISACFQGYRYYVAKYYVAKLGVQARTIFAFSEDSGVNVLRWLEYALTSPLQIILIGWTFDVVEDDTVMGLAAAQLALVLLGLPIERYIDKAYKNKIKAMEDIKGKYQKKAAQNISAAVAFFVLAAAVHGLMWTVLFRRYLNNQNQIECVRGQFDKKDEVKTVLDLVRNIIGVVVGFEFFLFTSFAVNLAISLIVVCQYQTPGELDIASGKTKDSETELRYKTNYNANWRYALLSVTSKVFLDFGLIYLVSQMGSVQAE